MAKSPEASESGLINISVPKSKTNDPIDFNGGGGAIVVACFWLALYVTAIVHSLMSNNQNSTATKNVEAIAEPTATTPKNDRDGMGVFGKEPQQ